MPGQQALAVATEPHAVEIDRQEVGTRLPNVIEVTRPMHADRYRQQEGQEVVWTSVTVDPKQERRQQVEYGDHRDEPEVKLGVAASQQRPGDILSYGWPMMDVCGIKAPTLGQCLDRDHRERDDHVGQQDVLELALQVTSIFEFVGQVLKEETGDEDEEQCAVRC